MVIELDRDKWSGDAAERIIAGLDRAVKIVRITPEYDRLQKLQSISEKTEPGDVRIDGVGNIYTTRWRVRETIEAGGHRQLVSISNHPHRVLSPTDKEREYLRHLPRTVDVPVVELLFSGVDSGVETAIRQQCHILEGYQSREDVIGKEAGQAMSVVVKADELANVFIHKNMKNKDLVDLSLEIAILLEDKELINPKDPNKKKMKDMLARAAQEDSTGKVNPMISRIRLRAAYMAGVRRLTVNGLIRKKYNSNLHRLIYEREVTRWALERAVTQLEIIMGHVGFRKDTARTPLQACAISNLLVKSVAEEFLTIPRVKPYLAPARTAAILLNGCREDEKEENRAILGEEAAERLFNTKPVVLFLQKRHFEFAGSSIIAAWATMKDVLKKYESIIPTT